MSNSPNDDVHKARSTPKPEPVSCGCSGPACCESVAESGPPVSRRTATEPIPVGTTLKLRDHLGALAARWGIGRMSFIVEPGLYAIGEPDSASPVLVSANYKLTFDRVRSQLGGRNAWLLVLDTKGINVWCAAGKGTFGTDELVHRLQITALADRVEHRRLIVPQLGATGVCAHEVRQRSGFKVYFGPVCARDLPLFIDSDLKCTPEMRRVRFPVRERVVLIPIEIVGGLRIMILAALALVVLAGLGRDGYSLTRVWGTGLRSALLLIATFLTGASLVPLLLPWLPGRAFAVKGAWTGAFAAAAVGWLAYSQPGLLGSPVMAVAWLLFIPTAMSFTGMNYTGASTYTSLSGVIKEMKVAVPLQIGFAGAAALLWLAGLFTT
ncbi:MAG: acetyl-CoA synthase subunit gamma [bacterium]|nr:acetyl-CoA synthase subunit gamma [bacterium]